MCLYCVGLCFHGVAIGCSEGGQITAALFSMKRHIESPNQM